MHNEIDNFYIIKEEPNKSCLLALRALIVSSDTKINETIKYGMPCFCYAKKPLFYLWVDKKTDEPYILMVEGKKLLHPKLEDGNRSKMKIFRVNAHEDLPVTTIKEILQEALKLHCL